MYYIWVGNLSDVSENTKVTVNSQLELVKSQDKYKNAYNLKQKVSRTCGVKSVFQIARAAGITAEIAFHRKERMMEEILREPVELTESELNEVAGGGGECGGCDGGLRIDIDVDVKLCL